MTEHDCSHLRVILVDDDPDRSALVESCLHQAGFRQVTRIPAQAGLLFRIEQAAPDVIVIELDSPGRDILESLSLVSAHNPIPIVMFSQEQDPDFIARAVDAGVTAYVVDGVRAEKVKPIIDVAMAQFRVFQQLKTALAETRSELTERRVIDRAKALLMERDGIGEDAAYTRLRNQAMNANRKLVQVARQLIETADRQRRKS